MKRKIIQKKNAKAEGMSEFNSYITLLKMLMHDRYSLSFKFNKKKTILKVTSFLFVFILLILAFYGIFFLLRFFAIFSVFAFLPPFVPSILTNFLFITLFFSMLNDITENLYFSQDNRFLITYPCKGRTIFLARLSMSFLTWYAKYFVAIIPIFFAYLFLLNYPIGMYLYLLFVFTIFMIAMIFLASVLSLPHYYYRSFLKRHDAVRYTINLTLIVLFSGSIIYGLSFIPDELDIFSSWGIYFTKIQEAMVYYNSSLGIFSGLTKFFIGNVSTGFVKYLFIEDVYIVVGLLLLSVLLFSFIYFFINKMYFKLASSSFEFENAKLHFKEKNSVKNKYLSQILKDAKIFLKNSKISSSYIFMFVTLPIAVVILNKIFGAINLSQRGTYLVYSVNFLIVAIFSLSTNSMISHIYSEEGDAFTYDKTYPISNLSLLTSRLFLPSLIGTLSIAISTVFLSSIKGIERMNTFFFALAAILFYLGHMLHAAEMDFTSRDRQFVNGSEDNKKDLAITFSAFFISIIMAILFFLFLGDGIFSAFLKLLIAGLIYFMIRVLIFNKNVKFTYLED